VLRKGRQIGNDIKNNTTHTEQFYISIRKFGELYFEGYMVALVQLTIVLLATANDKYYLYCHILTQS